MPAGDSTVRLDLAPEALEDRGKAWLSWRPPYQLAAVFPEIAVVDRSTDCYNRCDLPVKHRSANA
jgi:hypothetical protein